MRLPASAVNFVSAKPYMPKVRTNQINSVAPPTSPNRSNIVYVSLLVTFIVEDIVIYKSKTGQYSGYLAQVFVS